MPYARGGGRLHASWFGVQRRGGPPGPRGPNRRCRSSSSARPTSTGLRGWAPLHRKLAARRNLSTCANLTRGHKTARVYLADEKHQSPIRPASEGVGSRPSRRLRDGGAAWPLVPSRVERGRIRALAV